MISLIPDKHCTANSHQPQISLLLIFFMYIWRPPVPLKSGYYHKSSLFSTVLSWVWDGSTNPGSPLPDQSHQQPSSGGLWQRASCRLSGLQQRPLWESHWVVHGPLEPGMRLTGGRSGLKGTMSGADKCVWFYSDRICCNVWLNPYGLCVAVCGSVLCRVRRRQPAEVSGVSDEGRRRIHHHAALRVLVSGPASQPAELQPQGLWSKVVSHRLERCE